MPSSKSKPRSRKVNETAHRLSMATENYLLSIIRLEEQGVRVTLTQLAEHLKMLPVDEGLGTSLPSVGGMIRRMVREKLVDTTQAKDFVLTSSGRIAAESILRRHRLAERMVVDLLGIDLKTAHIEAHRLEHAISPDLEEKIVERLGNPKTCPFGHPIPGSGHQSDPRAMPLDKVRAGEKLIIDRVPEDDQSLLEYFVEHRLVPGQPVVVKEAAPARGVVTLDCDGDEVVFSYVVAEKIWACPKDSN